MSRTQQSSVLFDALGPRGRKRARRASLISVLVFVAIAAAACWQLASADFFEQSRWVNPLDALIVQTTWLPDLVNTLQAFALGSIGALLLGIIVGFGRVSRNRVVRFLAMVYVQFFRAIPLLLLIWIPFTIDGVFGFTTDTLGFDVEGRRLTFLVVGLAVYNGAVLAEIMRSGIAALPPGQAMAGYAVGLRHGQVMRMIVMPQALRNMLPAVLAQLVILLKDTALGYVITYPELLHGAQNIGRDYANSFLQALIIAAFIYFVLAYALSKVVVMVERRIGRKTASSDKAVRQVEAVASQ